MRLGKSLHARLRAYEPFGGTLGLLPEPISFQASFLHDDDGALNVTYSRHALGGDILHRTLEQGLEIAVEVSDGGPYMEPANARFLVIGRQGDNLDDTDTISINSAPSISWLLSKILNNDTSHLIQDGDNKGKRAFYSATAGTILKTFLEENKGRGGAASGLAMDFDTARDAGGDEWASEVTLYYSLGVSVQSALASLVGGSVVDWRTQGRLLRLWNADSEELSRDLSGTDVIHMHGGLQEAPYEESISGLASSILVEGDNGLVFTMDNPAAPKPWGAWESYVSQGGVSDEGTARAFMQHELEVAARVRGQYTRALNITDADHLPLIDYAQGDWITAPTIGHGEKVRVQQITVGYSDGAYTASIVLNDKKYDAQVRESKRIQGITGGATLAGSQGARPNTGNDHRVPKAPDGLTLASDAYLDSTGHARGLVSAVWGEVSQATDNTAIEIADYRVEWRYSDSDADAWMSAGVTADERLSWSGLDCGRTVVVRVRAIPTYSDKPGEWSDEASVLVASDVTPPSVPSAPRLSSETGIVSISWDGLPATGTGMDADFDHCEVGRGLTSGSLAVVSAAMTGRTQWVDTDVLPGAVWTYALRAVDHAGNKSAWSKTAQIEVVGAVSQEQIDKIQSDLAENEKTLAQAQKDIASNKQTIQKTNQTVEQVKSDVDETKQTVAGVRQDLTQANATLAQAQKDIASNKQTIQQTNQTVSQVQSDLTGTKNDLNGVKNDLSGVKTDLDKAQSDLTQVSNDLTEANKELDSVGKTASDAASKAQQAIADAASAQTTADGRNRIWHDWQDPTVTDPTIKPVAGDLWYRYQRFWTRAQGEPDNSPSLLANFYTYSEGEPDNSPSVLVPLESEIVEVLMWDGDSWNPYTLVASNVVASGTITGDLIAANTILADHLAAGSVTTDKLVSLAVTADKLAANSVTAGKIAALAVTADKLAANSVTAGKIAANAVTAGTIASGAVTTDKLAALAVTAAKIAALTITGDKIAANAISADKIAANAVTASEIASGAVTTDKLSANAVTAGTIASGAVTTDKLAALAVTAAKIAALTITGDKIAANAISADKITSNAVTADKLAANSVNASKIVSGAITADKLAANSVTAVKIAAGSITTDKIKAGQFQGYVFTGAIYQSSTAENTGFKLRDAGLDMWDSEHNHTVHLDGNGATNVVTGRFKTAFDGARIEFSTATVDDPQMGEIYTGAIDFHDSEGLVGQLYATSSGSGIGLIKIQPAGSQIAQMTVQRYSSSLTSEVGTTISANDGTGKTASVGANVLPTPSIGMNGALGKNGTFSWFQWKALDAGFGVHSYAHGTVNAMPLRYGRYYAWANADCNWAGIVAHVENTGGTSGWGVVFWNCDTSTAGGDIYCMTMGINAS